jgi:hypothetical protein
MESHKISSRELQKTPSIESTANYEGNDALLLIDRLRNQTIKNQIVQILFQEAIDRFSSLKNGQWEPYMLEGWTGEERFKLVKDKVTGRIIDSNELKDELNTPLPTLEEIEGEVDANINQIANVTEIDFTTDQPSKYCIHLGWIAPWTDKKLTEKQYSIIAAHEKGHRVREYLGSLDERFQRGFDRSKANFTEKDYDILKKDYDNQTSKQNGEFPPFEVEKEGYFDYLFSASEIAERMSQLKNYFGIQGAETFTKEHLQYAREHYVKDVGMDNGMVLFFQAITPETEDSFLELINECGI